MDRKLAIALICTLTAGIQMFAFAFQVDGQVLALTTSVFAAAIGYLVGHRDGE